MAGKALDVAAEQDIGMVQEVHGALHGTSVALGLFLASTCVPALLPKVLSMAHLPDESKGSAAGKFLWCFLCEPVRAAFQAAAGHDGIKAGSPET